MPGYTGDCIFTRTAIYGGTSSSSDGTSARVVQLGCEPAGCQNNELIQHGDRRGPSQQTQNVGADGGTSGGATVGRVCEEFPLPGFVRFCSGNADPDLDVRCVAPPGLSGGWQLIAESDTTEPGDDLIRTCCEPCPYEKSESSGRERRVCPDKTSAAGAAAAGMAMMALAAAAVL
jgi:hypothetical protein